MQDLQTEINQLKTAILHFLASVNYDNFGHSYDSFASIILAYKNRITDKKVMLDLILKIIREENLDENQEEVISEFYSRLDGWCSPNMEIVW